MDHNNLFNKIILLVLLLLSNLWASGQKSNELDHHNYAFHLIENNKDKLSQIATSTPFCIANNTNTIKAKANKAIFGDKSILSLDTFFNKKVIDQKDEFLIISLPEESGNTLTLQLKKVELFNGKKNNKAVGNNSGVFYWGTVAGDEKSFATFSVFQNNIMGIICTKNGTFSLGKIKDSEKYILYKETDLAEQQDFICNTQFDIEAYKKQSTETQKMAQAGFVNPDNCVRARFWADSSFYPQFGNDAAAITNYFEGYFSQIALFYANEHINTVLDNVTVVDENDNIVSSTDYGYGGYDYTMFLTYGDGGGGAGGPICGGGGAAHTGIMDYGSFPNLSGGVGVVAHEIGHVFGSPHTDVCVWNGNRTQLDDCGTASSPSSAGLCFDPYNPIFPPNSGTLMSYCGWDQTLGVGQQPGDLMRFFVYTSDCLSPCGLVCTDGNSNNICDVDECYPNPIVCESNINGSGWKGNPGILGETKDVVINPGQTVEFRTSMPTSGTSNWTGPNGFTSNQPQVTVTDEGNYNYSFSDGTCTYTKTFTITYNNCALSSINCSTNIANQGSTPNCDIGISTGETAVLSPYNNETGGAWSWTGPNGFTANTREVTVSDAGGYEVTYTKNGCSISKDLNILDCGAEDPFVYYVRTSSTGWVQAQTINFNTGETVTFGTATQGISVPDYFYAYWEWYGPNNFYARTREATVDQPGTYTVVMSLGACTWTTEYIVTLNGCVNPIVFSTNVNNQGWEQADEVAVEAGESVAISPLPATGTWSWIGPNGFTANQREITVSDIGTYTATYSDGTCTSSSEVNLIDCIDNPIICSYNLNSQGWTNYDCTIDVTAGEVIVKPLSGTQVEFGNIPYHYYWDGPAGPEPDGLKLFVSADDPSGIYTATLIYGPCIFTKDIQINTNICPDGSLKGSTCDDGDASTENDIVDDNCNCVGTPIPVVSTVKFVSKLMLEGFLQPNGEMTQEAKSLNLIPLQQPFNTAPWNYTGTETLANIPTDMIDWILINAIDASENIIETKAGILNKDGNITMFDGSPVIKFSLPTTDVKYISVHHKSHLAVVTEASGFIASGDMFFANIVENPEQAGDYIPNLDFTLDAVALGIEQVKFMQGTRCAISGDFDGNGIINNLDYNVWEQNNSAVYYYLNQDADGNGIVNNLDYNLWDINKSKVGNQLIQN